MDWPIGIALLLAIMLMGVPVAFALMLVGLAGVASIIGVEASMSLLAQTYFDNSRNYSLSVLPLFLMMGNFVMQAGIAEDLYRSAHAWLRHRRGGLAMATVVACGGFSSVCGSSLATAATMARVALPSMRRYGYPDGLATASIAAGGTLGILIPPSVILVFYGIIAGQDIGKLFLAGVIPGLIGVIGYMIAVRVSIRLRRIDLPVEPRLPLADRFRALSGVLGALILFAFVMGGIYLGVFTVTEAAGCGAAGALLLTLLRGRLTARETFATLFETAKMTATMFFILFGALTFANYVNLSGMTRDLQAMLALVGDNPLAVIGVMFLIYLVLGCVLESLSMIVLTVPIFYPVAEAAGFDLIWFGIFVVVATEISYITPPIGMNAFVLRSVVKGLDVATVFRGLLPFVALDIVRVALLVAVPAIALFLPSFM
ncbi:MAG: TRAP transporter large permease [Pseudomonadota bacterium]